MANISTANLQDKDIRALEIKQNKYIKCIGNPAELYIRVYPSNKKTFFIRYGDDRKMIKLKEFRQGIYSVAEARVDAVKILKQLEQGKSIDDIKCKNEKYRFDMLTEQFLKMLEIKGRKERYILKIRQRIEKHLYPKLKTKDVKDIKHSELMEILSSVFNPATINKSNLETTHRLISHLKEIFNIAMLDGYLDTNPADYLSRNFQNITEFKVKNGLDGRRKALLEKDDIKDFIIDLKEAKNIENQTKYAIFLIILTGFRPANIFNARWSEIDFKEKLWSIEAKNMKGSIKPHQIPLTKQMIHILKLQETYSKNYEFIFTGKRDKSKSMSDNTMAKAINSIKNGKWKDRLEPYGFRATFKTLCTLNLATLQSEGLSEATIEDAMHHQTNGIAWHYLRQKSKIEQKEKLFKWYNDYLFEIEPLY